MGDGKFVLAHWSTRKFYLYRYKTYVLLCLKLQIQLSSPLTLPPPTIKTTSIPISRRYKVILPLSKRGRRPAAAIETFTICRWNGFGQDDTMHRSNQQNREQPPANRPKVFLTLHHSNHMPQISIGVWQKELETWLTVTFDIYVIASAKDFPPSPPPRRSITLINYDFCHKFRERLHCTQFTPYSLTTISKKIIGM